MVFVSAFCVVLVFCRLFVVLALFVLDFIVIIVVVGLGGYAEGFFWHI